MAREGKPLGLDKNIIMAFFAASAFFLLFLSVMNVSEEKTNKNIYYGSFNTSQTLELYNTTYIKVYYSQLCPACAKELPILEELAEKGTIIEMIEVNEEPEAAEKDSVAVTPTIFIINGPDYQRIDGFATLDELGEAIWMVSNKSKLVRE